MIQIDLRDLLKWTYGEELVHVATGSGSSWSQMASLAALGTVIDRQGFGGFPELASVHPDAVKVHEEVTLGIANCVFDLPRGWNPFPDMDDPHGLIADCVAEVLHRRAMRAEDALNANLMAMVISFSIMGREPEWRADQPRFRMVNKAGQPAWFVRAASTDAFGRVFAYEQDGFNKTARRPKPGAYRKFKLSDPFGGAVQGRIDWYFWARALQIIAERLQTGLTNHRIRPLDIDREIWKNPPVLHAAAQGIEIMTG